VRLCADADLVQGSFPRALFASVVPFVMRENADRSVFPSMIEPPPNCFSCVIAYVMARICMFFRPICTTTDGKTDAALEMIQAPSRMEKQIHLRFHASRTGQRTQKAPVETTLYKFS
jgi:hypothetical protein